MAVKDNVNYIIILNYNNWEDTIECVESVINSSYEDFKLIILDNNSLNNAQDQIIKYLKGEIKPIIKDAYLKTQITKRTASLPYVFF